VSAIQGRLAWRIGGSSRPAQRPPDPRASSSSASLGGLLYSSRSYEEIFYREELEDLVARDGSLGVIHTSTHSRPEGWSGYHGRIDTEMLSEVAWSPDESPLAFVCGPTSCGRGWRTRW
jgi:ferredoxin-NADP reductase